MNSAYSPLFLSLFSEKIRALIVGGGRAASIKAKTLAERGCRVTVLAPRICDDIRRLESARLTLIAAPYEAARLSGVHLVVIATDNPAVNAQIQADCEAQAKLFLTCGSARDGLFVTPVMRETEQTAFAVHTKSGSPRTALFLAEKLADCLKKYDAFVAWVAAIRRQAAPRGDKDEIMRLLNTDESFELFQKGHLNIMR